MKVYVMVDAEGLCGIHLNEQVNPSGSRYAEMCRFMTKEINACVAGLIEGGACQVYVQDAHHSGNNAILSELTTQAAGYVMGQCGGTRMPGLEHCDAVVLLGYHAMAGTQCAILEHTMSHEWQNFYMNGEKAGELAYDAAVAGSYGKPVILVTGDDAVCREARKTLGDIVTAEVKQALGLYGAIHLPLETGHALVRERAKEAVTAYMSGRFKPYVVTTPVTMRLELAERVPMPNPTGKPYMTVIDARTFEVSGDTPEEAMARLE